MDLVGSRNVRMFMSNAPIVRPLESLMRSVVFFATWARLCLRKGSDNEEKMRKIGWTVKEFNKLNAQIEGIQDSGKLTKLTDEDRVSLALGYFLTEPGRGEAK